MKKIVGISMGIIAVITIVLGFIWLRKPEEDYEVIQEIKSQEGDPTLSIYGESLTRSGANFIVYAGSIKGENVEYTFNRSYRIEQKINGKWQKVPLVRKAEKIDTSETYESGEEWIDWTNRYGKLKNGMYRYVKSVEKDGKKIYFAEEFTIDDTTPAGRDNRQYPKEDKITYTLKEGSLTRESATFFLTVLPPANEEAKKMYTRYFDFDKIFSGESNTDTITFDEYAYSIGGEQYLIEYKKDGVWTECPLIAGAALIVDYEGGLLPIKADGIAKESKRNWSRRYGKLPNGEYRYIRWTGNNGTERYYWAEFTIDNNTPDGEPKESKINEEISMTIKEGTLTPSGATVVITDKVERETGVINDYYFLAKQNGEKWEELEVKKRPNTVNLAFEKEQVREKEIDWSEKYGDLPAGTYRLVMERKFKIFLDRLYDFKRNNRR